MFFVFSSFSISLLSCFGRSLWFRFIVTGSACALILPSLSFCLSLSLICTLQQSGLVFQAAPVLSGGPGIPTDTAAVCIGVFVFVCVWGGGVLKAGCQMFDLSFRRPAQPPAFYEAFLLFVRCAMFPSVSCARCGVRFVEVW